MYVVMQACRYVCVFILVLHILFSVASQFGCFGNLPETQVFGEAIHSYLFKEAQFSIRIMFYFYPTPAYCPHMCNENKK